ncbi:unnamed protein product [Lampetra fluviatilis]
MKVTPPPPAPLPSAPPRRADVVPTRTCGERRALGAPPPPLPPAAGAAAVSVAAVSGRPEMAMASHDMGEVPLGPGEGR